MTTIQVLALVVMIAVIILMYICGEARGYRQAVEDILCVLNDMSDKMQHDKELILRWEKHKQEMETEE